MWCFFDIHSTIPVVITMAFQKKNFCCVDIFVLVLYTISVRIKQMMLMDIVKTVSSRINSGIQLISKIFWHVHLECSHRYWLIMIVEDKKKQREKEQKLIIIPPTLIIYVNIKRFYRLHYTLI